MLAAESGVNAASGRGRFLFHRKRTRESSNAAMARGRMIHPERASLPRHPDDRNGNPIRCREAVVLRVLPVGRQIRERFPTVNHVGIAGSAGRIARVCFHCSKCGVGVPEDEPESCHGGLDERSFAESCNRPGEIRGRVWNSQI